MLETLRGFGELGYLVASLLFIFGLKGMSHPRTAVRGNVLGMAGMAVAILFAIAQGMGDGNERVVSYVYIALGLAIGSAVGVYLAFTVKMTGMPQMVALLNGLGGAASVLVGWADLFQNKPTHWDELFATALSGLIGAITLTGSLFAYAKLEEWPVVRKPWEYPFQRTSNLIMGIVLLLLVVGMVYVGGSGAKFAAGYANILFILIVLLSAVLGITLVNPIGGADMPVVISLLNSYSGLAGAATGFVINNNVLIIAGSLVGASGIILTQIMCKAMNRSLVNVLFGIGAKATTSASNDEVYANVRSTTPEDVAMILDGAQRVVFVPGYGMAVAQAQHAVRDLGKALEEKGATVEYAIHPVAGRMPGHMNVLLAEADIAYEKLKEMDAINPTMDTVDVAIVIGANDVVNPVAQTDPASPIAGMPIIEVSRCKTVIIVKRSLSPGFAGIPNPLFAAPNALMLFADGKDAILEVVKALKDT